jgi:hypothetical protein
MTQVVSRRPLTAGARVHDRVNPCGICGGQSCTGAGFSSSSSVFPCLYHSTIPFYKQFISSNSGLRLKELNTAFGFVVLALRVSCVVVTVSVLNKTFCVRLLSSCSKINLEILKEIAKFPVTSSTLHTPPYFVKEMVWIAEYFCSVGDFRAHAHIAIPLAV